MSEYHSCNGIDRSAHGDSAPCSEDAVVQVDGHWFCAACASVYTDPKVKSVSPRRKLKWKHRTKLYSVKCYSIKGQPDYVELIVRSSYKLTLGMVLLDDNGKPIPPPPSPPPRKLPTEEELAALFQKIASQQPEFIPKH